ncbi:MAG TPA: J domain-containing protein [Acidimicrobiales bacterium]|nr:J domain-containing protein [Acidimicrobiales bacterium]
MTLLAELEVRHSRPFSPTRRVALGRLWLPSDPAPGFGGMLLAGIVAAGVSALEDDEEVLDRLDVLLDDLQGGHRVVQPRCYYRFQVDVHGLDRSHHRLVGEGDRLHLDIDGHGAVLPQVLAAIYAASQLSYAVRGQAFRLIRRATRWTGGIDDRLLSFLGGDEAGSLRRRILPNDERWALAILGFPTDSEPGRSDIQKRFRQLVRDAHPDHGADTEGAGQRILELTEAKRILLEIG